MPSHILLGVGIVVSLLKGNSADCIKSEPRLPYQEHISCRPNPLVPDGSLIREVDMVLSSADGGDLHRNISKDDLICSLALFQDAFVQINFEDFYDVCAIATWGNDSKVIGMKYTVQFSTDGDTWKDNKEIGPTKVTQGVGNYTSVRSNTFQLTSKFLRIRPSELENRLCFQVAVYGQLAMCNNSQLRMDLWCNTTFGFPNKSRNKCSGELKARYDRGRLLPTRWWRCYHLSALTTDLSTYDVHSGGSCYYLRHRELKNLAKSCTQKSKSEVPQKCHQNFGVVPSSLGAANISEVIVKFDELINKTSKNRLSSNEILDTINILEKMSHRELLKDATPHDRDLYAKSFMHLSSNLLKERNIEIWTANFLNSSLSSRFLKAVEEFGATFISYVDCDNGTENEREFYTDNINYRAFSCTNRTTFPQGALEPKRCNGKPYAFQACNEWQNNMDSVIIPSLLSTVRPKSLSPRPRKIILDLIPLPLPSQTNASMLCGFWNYSLSQQTYGAWSTKGCTMISTTPTKVTCECSHLTNFALLLQVTPHIENDGKNREFLMWITYVGCSLSFAAEILCLLVFAFLTSQKGTKIQIHINLVSCLGLGHLIFLTGVENAAGREVLCRAVAVCLQFLFLASFTWMLVEGIYLLYKVNTVTEQKIGRKRTYGFAYGVPLVVVATSLATKFDDYGAPEHCWLSIKSGTIWSFIGPVCVVILINFAILGLVMKKLTSTSLFRSKSDLQKIRATIRASFLMLPLLGLTWVFGLMAINEKTIVFQYIFVLFNSFQGIFLFLFLCAANEEVKSNLRSFVRKRRVTQQVTKQVTNRQSNGDAEQVPQRRFIRVEAFSKVDKGNEPTLQVMKYIRRTKEIRISTVAPQASSKTPTDHIAEE